MMINGYSSPVYERPKHYRSELSGAVKFQSLRQSLVAIIRVIQICPDKVLKCLNWSNLTYWKQLTIPKITEDSMAGFPQ